MLQQQSFLLALQALCVNSGRTPFQDGKAHRCSKTASGIEFHVAFTFRRSFLCGESRSFKTRINERLRPVSAESPAEIYAAALPLADELFLTGTGAEVVPVRVVDGRPLSPSRPITDAVGAAFRAHVDAGPAVWSHDARTTVQV